MSILETFYILFKSDSSDVKKGADEATRSTEKLNTSLKNTSNNANHASQQFLRMGRSLAAVVTAFVSVQGIAGGLRSAFEYTLQIEQASRALDVNAESLDAWGNAVRKNGGTAQGFAQSIKNLATHLDITNQNALDLLPKLADSFKGAGAENANDIGTQLGLDQATILLLQQGQREVSDLIKRQKELGVITKQDTEVVKKFNDAWVDISNSFRRIFLSVGAVVFPVLEKIFDEVSKFSAHLLRHKPIITGALIAIGLAATYAAAPFLIMTGIVLGLGTAFALIYDDLVNFSEGNKSVTGYLLKEWPKVGAVLSFVFNTLKEDIQHVINAFKILQHLWKTGTLTDSKLNIAQEYRLEKQAGQLGLSYSDLELGKHFLQTASNAPISSLTSSSILNTTSSNRSISVNVGDITIKTDATDAEGISTYIGKSLTDQLREAMGNYEDGVVV